ncbi:MAG: OadG family transporter subunit [Prolixibacteraceae bacterium]
MLLNIRKSILSVFVILLLAVSGTTLLAQNAGDLKFNEILIYNDSNYVDDYGMHSPWIEIVNSSYSNVNIGGCFLTDDLNEPRKYWIPTGVPATAVDPRSYLVFYADNQPTRGVFHLNFDLRNAKVIALFDANGRTLIDKLEISGTHRPDVSYARVSPDSDQWEFKKNTTPGSDNDYKKKATSGEQFVEMDPSGIGMTIIAMMVVFSALALLFVIFKNIGRAFTRTKTVKVKDIGAIQTAVAPSEISGEVNAAIAMALYLYQNEMHDYENTVLTVKKVARTYSPWSSKIYTLRKNPR